MTKRAIILIPGLLRAERNHRRDTLIANLQAVSSRHPATDPTEVQIGGLSGVQLTVTDYGSGAGPAAGASASQGQTSSPSPSARPDMNKTTRTVDVFEAYWGDMVIDRSLGTPFDRLVRGLGLLSYWFLSPVWGAFRHNRALTLGLLSSGVLLLLWYFSIVIVASEALLAAQSSAGESSAIVSPLVSIAGFLLPLAQFVTQIPDWSYYVVIVGIFGASNADRVADIATFCRDYLTDHVNETGIGLRNRVGQRVRDTFDLIHSEGYDEVIVVGFSFGAVVAVDVLADHPDGAKLARTRLVTWGAPLTPLVYRSVWMRGEVKALLARTDLAGWDDFHSRVDWLGAPVPGHARETAARQDRSAPWLSERLALEAGLWQILGGQAHLRYFQSQRRWNICFSADPRACASRDAGRRVGRR